MDFGVRFNSYHDLSLKYSMVLSFFASYGIPWCFSGDLDRWPRWNIEVFYKLSWGHDTLVL